MNRALARASVWSTWTLGSLFGAFNLLMIHTRLLGNPPSHNQSHAGVQIWGFVFLFVAATSPAGPVLFILWGTLAAQALITWGRVDVLPGALPALVAGSFLQLAAVLAWSRRAPAWILAAALLAAGAVEAVLERDVNASLRWAHAMYAVALFGAAFPWLHPCRAGRALSVAGAALMAAGAVARSTAAWDVGFLLAAGSGLFFPGPMAKLFALLGGGYAIADLVVGASGLVLDAARHAFTIGVLLPALLERAGARSPWGTRLLVAGALLRQAQVLAAVFGSPSWLYVSAASGLIAAAGTIPYGRALLRRPPSAAPPG